MTVTISPFDTGIPAGHTVGSVVFLSLDMVDRLNGFATRTGGLTGDFTVTAAQVSGGIFASDLISEESITQHQGALSIATSQLTGALENAQVSAGNVTQHQASLSIGASQTTAGEFADARISESSVTQHALPKPSVNPQTGTAYTLVTGDAFDTVTMDNAMPNTVTIPAGITGHVDIWQIGVGATTVEGDTGVTVNGSDGGTDVIGAQFTHVRAQNIAANTWVVG
jgi:hypothetical protein